MSVFPWLTQYAEFLRFIIKSLQTPISQPCCLLSDFSKWGRRQLWDMPIYIFLQLSGFHWPHHWSGCFWRSQIVTLSRKLAFSCFLLWTLCDIYIIEQPFLLKLPFTSFVSFTALFVHLSAWALFWIPYICFLGSLPSFYSSLFSPFWSHPLQKLIP